MRKRPLLVSLSAAALAAGLLVAAPTARAEERDPGALAIEAVEKLMLALRLVFDDIPRYELPEVLPNGDIIIRRKHDEAEDLPSVPEPDQGQAPELAL